MLPAGHCPLGHHGGQPVRRACAARRGEGHVRWALVRTVEPEMVPSGATVDVRFGVPRYPRLGDLRTTAGPIAVRDIDRPDSSRRHRTLPIKLVVGRRRREPPPRSRTCPAVRQLQRDAHRIGHAAHQPSVTSTTGRGYATSMRPGLTDGPHATRQHRIARSWRAGEAPRRCDRHRGPSPACTEGPDMTARRRLAALGLALPLLAVRGARAGARRRDHRDHRRRRRERQRRGVQPPRGDRRREQRHCRAAPRPASAPPAPGTTSSRSRSPASSSSRRASPASPGTRSSTATTRSSSTATTTA